MRRRITECLGVVSLLVTLGAASSASAVTYDSPYGADGATAYVGSDAWGQWIGWKSKSTGDCHWDPIGPPTGLTEQVQVSGGTGNDNITILSWNISNWCGWPLSPPNYGGQHLDIKDQGGFNVFSSGTGLTYIFGGGGGSHIYSARAYTWLSGGQGQDLIVNSGSGWGMQYDSHGGDDCLMVSSAITGVLQATCGDGNDQYWGPGPVPSDCEAVVCCGLC